MRKRESGAGNPRDLAMRLLTARSLSRAELERKLTQRGVTAEERESTLVWLEELGLLNDEEYAGQLVRSYSAKGWGYYKIRQELLRRGVPRGLWDRALEELPDPGAAIGALLEKRLEPEADQQQIQKCVDALLRRGFSRRDIMEALGARGEVSWDD